MALHIDYYASLNSPWTHLGAARIEAMAMAEELGMLPAVAECHLGLGELGRRTGQGDAGAEHLSRAIALFRQMNMSEFVSRAERGRRGLTE